MKKIFFIFSWIWLASVYSCGKKNTSKNSLLNDNDLSDFTFEGDGFTPHESQNITMAIISPTEQKRIEIKSQVVNSGKFLFQIKELLEPNKTYFLDYFADVNGNGQCDPPTTDHVWRVEVNTPSNTEGNSDTSSVVIKEEHHMNFLGSCQSFSADDSQPTGSKIQTIVGNLKLDSSISAQGFEPGQTLSQGQVFLEGYPDQATRSDQSGQFILKISTNPALTELTSTNFSTQKPRLFMWYSQKNNLDQKKSWTLSEFKFGAAKEISLSEPSLDIGSQALTYTKGIKLKTIDQITKKFVSNCWIYSPSFLTKLPVKTDPEEFHQIDYLPEGTYPFEILCQGYAKASTQITVTKALSTKDPWESPPPIELKLLSP